MWVCSISHIYFDEKDTKDCIWPEFSFILIIWLSCLPFDIDLPLSNLNA